MNNFINYNNKRLIEGYYKTEIIYKNGKKYVTPESGLNKNLVVDSAGALMAGLFMGDNNFNYGNIYLAYGTGSASWDALQDKGKSNETVDTTILENEIFRKLPTTKTFITALGGSSTNDRTEFVRLTYDFDDTEMVGETLREFGLFGGDATSALESGVLFDYVIHTAFYKDAEIKTFRRIFDVKF